MIATGEKMSKNDCLSFIIIALLDAIALNALRDILLDFLIGSGNRKSARKIYNQQRLKDRITLGFIKQYIKRNLSSFKAFYRAYMIELFSLLPQYVSLFSVYILYRAQNKVYLISVIVIKLALNIILRLQVDPLMRSKYRGQK